MATTTTNGEVRKTLAGQLDRPDSILDGLGAGLNEAVATAVQGAVEAAVRQAVSEGVKEAVQGALAEVLTNPDLGAARHDVLPCAPSLSPRNPPGPPQKLLGRVWRGVKAGPGTATASVKLSTTAPSSWAHVTTIPERTVRTGRR